jgi:cytochrome P450
MGKLPKFMNAPGPTGGMMLRSILRIRNDAPGFLGSMQKQFGPVVQFPIPKPLAYFVNSPDAVDHVLRIANRNYGKSTIQYRTLSLVTGQGLLSADTAIWREQRRIVQPAFHHEIINDVVGHSVRATKQTIENLNKRTGEAVDVDSEMMNLALNVVGSALFGSNLNEQASHLVKATLDGLDVIISRARTPIFPASWIPTPINQKLKRSNRRLDETVQSLIEEAVGRDQSSPTMLDLLVSGLEDTQLTTKEVRDQVVTFIVAGHETVASALIWTLHLISSREDVQQKIYDEVITIVGKRDLTLNDYSKLIYTKAVLSEAMRLYPPAWLITRNCVSDDEVAGVKIRTGSLVIVSPWATHRNEKYWPNPDLFNPDRFLDETKILAGSYLPFGLGARMCIGKDFALLEGVIALAMLIRSFTFTPTVHNVVVLPSVTVRPKHGLPLKLVRR